MKMRKFFSFILVCVFMLSLTSMVGAEATVEINLAKLLPKEDLLNIDDFENTIVSEVKEDKNYYYFMLSNKDTTKGIAILKVLKIDFSKTEIISIYNTEELKGYTIDSMEVQADGTLWLNLVGLENKKACKVDVNGEIRTVDYSMNSRTKHGNESIIWLEEGNDLIKQWDGRNIKSYSVSNANIIDFSEHEGKIHYLNVHGDIYIVKEQEDIKITNLLLMFNLSKEDSLETGSLASAGGKLWSTMEIRLTPNIGLLNVTDTKVIDEVTPGKIYKTIENSDGSLYILMDKYFPIGANQYPSDDISYEVMIQKDSKIIINDTKNYWGDLEYKYIDSLQNTWTYNLKSSNKLMTKTDNNQNSLDYYLSKNSTKPNQDIKVKYKDIEVEFDVNPYIKNQSVLIPIRGVASLFGSRIQWDNNTQTAIIQKDGVMLSLAKGENIAYLNGEQVFLDVPLEIKDGRLMVPLRFVGESLSLEVNWDQQSRTVSID